MRWLAHSLVLVIFLASCATTPSTLPEPALPIGEFIDQVLDPLAGKIAAERIQQAQAELKAGQLSPSLRALLGIPFGTGGAAVSSGLKNASIEQLTAQLDARRLPLKKELLALFTRRAKAEGDQYSVCVEGSERRYGVQNEKFVRLGDSSYPCETARVLPTGELD